MVPKGIIVLASSVAPGSEPDGVALQRVANRPIVCHVMEEMRLAGITEAVLVVSAHELVKLQACIDTDGPEGLEIVCVCYESDDRFQHALSTATELVGDSPCIVHLGNGLLAQPLEPLVEILSKDAQDLIALLYEPSAGPGSIGLATRRLLRLASTSPADGMSNEERPLDLAGACLFGPGALRRAGGIRWRQGLELDLVAMAEKLVNDGGRLRVESVRGWWRYVGEVGDLLDMNRYLLDTLILEPANLGKSADSRIDGCVAIDPTAFVQSSVILGPVIVGPGAMVLDAYIGPYTSIGADVRIEGAEVERSIILPGASITHIGGRLVGSVVGRQVRIFRDFSLPRAIRVNVGDGGEVALC
jgi:glucose-1-phosphate thymidylyltransferase